MSLFREDGKARLLRAVALRRERRHAAVRRAYYGADGKAVPATHVTLSGDDAELFLRHEMRRRQQEQEGFVQGDAATQVTEIPAVREEIEALEQ